MPGCGPEPSTELGPAHHVTSRMFLLGAYIPSEESGLLSQICNLNHLGGQDMRMVKSKASLGNYLKSKKKERVQW